MVAVRSPTNSFSDKSLVHALIYPVHREYMVCQINPYRSNVVQDFPQTKRVTARFVEGKSLLFR